MAAAAERGYALGVNTGIATTDVAIPSAVNVGDWMAVQFVTSGGSITMSTPTGWTLLAYSGVVNTRSMYLFGKRKASGDPSTVTFTASAASAITWSLVYGSGGVVDPASWIKRTYVPAGNTAARGYDIRRTYYEEQVAAGSPAGYNRTTRLRGMAVPANSLVLSAFGEASGTSETESEITSTGATRWFFAPHQGSNINTHWWAKEFVTTAKTTADIFVVYPQVQSDNGAGVQIAIPELVETVPDVNFQTSFEASNPLTVGGTSNFETTTVNPRRGTTALRRVANANVSTHSQVVNADAYTIPTQGLQLVGYATIDTTNQPNLVGLTFGAASDGTGGYQFIIDSRNGAGGSSVSSLQIRNNLTTAVVGVNIVGAILGNVRYRLEVDLRADGGMVFRVYNDATNEFIGKLGTTAATVASGRVGVYSYGPATFDDISLLPMSTTPRLARKAVLPDNSIGDVTMTYFDGGKEINPTRVEYSHKGTLVPELLSTSRVWTMAHRGGSLDYQEHTMRGYYQSTVAHADVIEISLVVSKDGTFWCAHDREPDRTTSGLPIAGKYFSDYTDAEISAMVQNLPNRGDSRFGNDRYYKLSEILAQYGQGTHGVMIDPKYITGTNLTNLINYLKTFANYQNIFIGKFFHTGISIAQLFSNAGMITWGYGYEEAVTGLKSDGSATTDPLFSATAQYWTMLGLNYEAPASVWAQMMTIAGSKKVIAHICPTAAAADIGVSKGAKAIQASGINSVSTKY